MADVLMGKAQGLPYDIQTEQVRLARQRKVLEALIARSLGSVQPIQAGNTVRANWGDAVGNLADALAARKQGEALDSREQEVAGQLRTQTETGVQDLIRGLQGYTQSSSAPPPGTVGPPEANTETQIPPNPVAAIAKAMASKLPGVTEMATGAWGAMNKGQLTPKDILTETKDLSAPDRAKWLKAAGMNPEIVGFNPKPSFHVAGDMGVTEAGGTPTAITPLQTYDPVSREPVTGAPIQTSQQTGKATGISGGNVTPTAKREEVIAGGDVKRLEEGYKDAKDAVAGLSAIGRANGLIRSLDPAQFGTLAGVKMWVNQTIVSLGGQPNLGATKAEELNASLGNLLLDKIRLLAPVTKEDVATMRGIVGSTANTKQALTDMLAFAEKTLARKIDTHNQFVDKFASEPGAGGAAKWKVNFTTGDQPAGDWSNLFGQPDATAAAPTAAARPPLESFFRQGP